MGLWRGVAEDCVVLHWPACQPMNPYRSFAQPILPDLWTEEIGRSHSQEEGTDLTTIIPPHSVREYGGILQPH